MQPSRTSADRQLMGLINISTDGKSRASRPESIRAPQHDTTLIHVHRVRGERSQCCFFVSHTHTHFYSLDTSCCRHRLSQQCTEQTEETHTRLCTAKRVQGELREAPASCRRSEVKGHSRSKLTGTSCQSVEVREHRIWIISAPSCWNRRGRPLRSFWTQTGFMLQSAMHNFLLMLQRHKLGGNV